MRTPLTATNILAHNRLPPSIRTCSKANRSNIHTTFHNNSYQFENPPMSLANSNQSCLMDAFPDILRDELLRHDQEEFPLVDRNQFTTPSMTNTNPPSTNFDWSQDAYDRSL